MQLSFKETKLGLRNSTTRLPFRYGKACLTRCPQAVMRATVEIDGRRTYGFSGDCFPPGWFDKTPGKSFEQQIREMLAVIDLSAECCLEEFQQVNNFFSAWLTANKIIHARAAEMGWTPLLASFGLSMIERAIMDAMCRAAGVSFGTAVRNNLFQVTPAEVHPELSGIQVKDSLPEQPLRSVFVRHTVGLADPLSAADIPESERLDDGFPQTLEEYIEQTGIRYLKIKVSNQLDHDFGRIVKIAELIERHRGDDYRVTLDGNEQYSDIDQFLQLIDRVRDVDTMETFWRNTLVLEQPLERMVALDPICAAGVRKLYEAKPVIIDESDGELDSYARAIELGYRGVSSKNCKGPVKSLLNSVLTWYQNQRGTRTDYWMTAEDLCSVGLIPLQADLCLTATLGITHVERNGHHYHPGLSYLPQSTQDAALVAHGDLYARQHGRISPRLMDGQFDIGSLQCAGFGFAVEPDFSGMMTPDQWEFSSLGLEE